MEQNAVIANIATIITKDLLIDEPHCHFQAVTAFPLLTASSDAEAEEFALLRRKRRAAVPHAKARVSRIAKPKRKAEDQPAQKLNRLEWQFPQLNLLHRYVDAQFESYLHMRKLTFLKIHQTLEDMLVRHALPGAPKPQTTLSLAMWKLTTDDHFEEIARKFQVNWSQCQQVVRAFWNVISDNYESFIKWPNSLAMQDSTLMGFKRLPQLRSFPQLFGIIALKRLDIFLECEHAEVAVILQLICNAEQKIIDCYVELAQEYSFEESPIGQTLALNARTLPSDSYLIGNNVFPLKSYLIRPIEAECFQKDAVFNSLLEPAFQLANSVLDTLARRFNTLYALEARDLNEVRLIVESICAMHNLCVDFKDDYLQQPTDAAAQQFSWGRSADAALIGINGSEKDAKGLRRRVELIDALVVAEQSEDS